MVRLKVSRGANVNFHYSDFNSTMVRLKALQSRCTEKACRHFNSTMVRLKDCPDCYEYDKETKFQFHYGTIKSTGKSFVFSFVVYFNSTMVRLKVWMESRRRKQI